MRTNFTLVGASLSATLTAAALAGGPAWENLLVLNGTNELPTLAGAVMVPNSTNNPVIDGNGDVTLRLQLGGAGITTANSRIVYHGHTGAWSILARDGSAVPSNTPAGYVFNSTTGINGLASSNNISESGGVLVSGNINGTGNSTLLDTAMYFLPSGGGTPFLLVRESDPCPGTAGAIMSSAMTAGSGQQTNDLGQSLFATATTGGDTVTTGAGANNSAIVLFDSGSDQLVMRKGTAGKSLGYSGLTITPDTFGLWLNGSKYAFSAKLVGTGITAANDSIYITNINGNKDQVQYQVSVSANADARQANAQEVAQHAYYCATPTGNLMDGLYADLKQQVGFEGAEDC
jgi:hypothetical protein